MKSRPHDPALCDCLELVVDDTGEVVNASRKSARLIITPRARSNFDESDTDPLGFTVVGAVAWRRPATAS